MRYFVCFYRTRIKFISWKVTTSQFKSVLKMLFWVGLNSFMRHVWIPRCAVIFLFRCLHRCRFVVCIYFLLCFWKNWRESGPACISFSAFKMTLSVSPWKNKNRKLKRLVTMKIYIFQFATFAVCTSVKDYSVLLRVERESRYQTVCGNFLPQIYPFTQILIAVELSVLVITTSH